MSRETRRDHRPRLPVVGLIICAGLMLIIIPSMFVTYGYDAPHFAIAVRSGSVYYWVGSTDQPEGVFVGRRWPYAGWWLDLILLRISLRHGWLPLWIPLAIVGIPTLQRMRRVLRQPPPGHCPKCGYNLTGNTTGRCPECGTTVCRSARVSSRGER